MKKRKFAEGGELPQDLTDRIAREENAADREIIMGPLRKVKELGGKAWDYAKTHSLKDLYDSMDQRSIADVVKGKPPVYKDVEKKAKGGKVSSASKRADGCCVKGKTKGRMV